MPACKKTCIELGKIEAVLKERFTDVKKNVHENHVSALFKSGRDSRVLLVTLKPEGEIITSYIFTNEKTGRTNKEHKRFKTLEGLRLYVESVHRGMNAEGNKSRYEIHKLSDDFFQVCDNVKGMCFKVKKEDIGKYT